MASLPEWVLKYKTKGIYARKTKTGYALYRGHSERVPGKSYPVFRCDEYLGIVTEEHGLTPSKPPVKPGIRVLRFGFYCVAETTCQVLRKHPEKLGVDVNILFVKAVLGLEGKETQQGYEGSWWSMVYPGMDLQQSLTDRQEYYLSVLRRQVVSKLNDRFGDDYDELFAHAGNLYAVHVNEGWHLSTLSEHLKQLASSYGLSFELGGAYHGV